MDFLASDAKQGDNERERILTLKAEARTQGKSEAELEELDTFTTRGWKEEPGLKPLEQDVVLLARYGTADRDLLSTLPPDVVDNNTDYTLFEPVEFGSPSGHVQDGGVRDEPNDLFSRSSRPDVPPGP